MRYGKCLKIKLACPPPPPPPPPSKPTMFLLSITEANQTTYSTVLLDETGVPMTPHLAPWPVTGNPPRFANNAALAIRGGASWPSTTYTSPDLGITWTAAASTGLPNTTNALYDVSYDGSLYWAVQRNDNTFSAGQQMYWTSPDANAWTSAQFPVTSQSITGDGNTSFYCKISMQPNLWVMPKPNYQIPNLIALTSVNQGSTWSPVNCTTDINISMYAALVTDDLKAFVCGFTNNSYASLKNLANPDVELCPFNVFNTALVAMAQDRVTGHLYAAGLNTFADTTILIKSINGGSNWTSLTATNLLTGIRGIAAINNVVIVCVSQGRDPLQYWASSDGGVSFTQIPGLLNTFAVDPQIDIQIIY